MTEGSARKEKLLAPPTRVVLETLAVVLAAFAAQIVLNGLGLEPDGDAITATTLIAGALTQIGWVLLVVSLLSRPPSMDWKLPRTGVAWLKEVAWGLALFAMATGASFAVGRFAQHASIRSGATYWTPALADPGTRLAFLLLGPLSAFHQEMLCRVYLQTRTTQVLRGHPLITILLCSWLFAAMHGYAASQSLAVFVVGVVFGTSFQINRRIPRIVVAHAAGLVVPNLLHSGIFGR